MVSQVEALDAALVSLELEPRFDLLVAFCRGLAEQIDVYPSRATLWREYRPAVEALVSAGSVEEDDGQVALLRLLSTPVGDPSASGEAQSGSGGRGGGSNGGPTADAVASTGRGRRSRTSA